jgi:formylglycine-generating enzyme required for sulfatase activity
VVNVGAADAVAFAAWGKGRLPTWLEWERAARGPERRAYPWGGEYDARRCNSVESERGSLAEVDEYPSGDSPEGARQMCGNVAEWVVGPQGEFEQRGGSHRLPCELWGLVYAFRDADAGEPSPDVGFRVVSD